MYLHAGRQDTPSSWPNAHAGWISGMPKPLKLVELGAGSVPGRGPCRLSADGRYLIASCEFSGQLVKLDVTTRALLGT